MWRPSNPFSPTCLMITTVFAGVFILGTQLGTPQIFASTSDHPDPRSPDEGPQEGDDPGCGGCDGGVEGGNQQNRGTCDVPETTEDPVLLADGAVLMSATDLNLPGKTFGFRLSRSYNSFYPTSQVYSGALHTGAIGTKWRMDYGAMRLRNVDNDYTTPYVEDIALGRSASSKRTFTYDGSGGWNAPSGYNAKLTKTTVNYDLDGDGVDEVVDVFVLEMLGRGEGNKYTFWGYGDNEGDLPVEQYGRIWKKTDRYGLEELTYQYESAGRRVDTITSTQGWTVQLSYVGTTGSLRWRVKTVTAYDGPAVSDNVIAKVTYYYVDDPAISASTDTGSYGDLIGVKVEKADSAGALSIVDWTQYRYHPDMTGLSDNQYTSFGSPPNVYWGYTAVGGDHDYYPENDLHYLKAVFDNDTLERFVANTGVNIPDVETVMEKADNWTDGPGEPTLSSYASKWFEYYTTFVANNTQNITGSWGDTGSGENMETAYGTTSRNELPFPYWAEPAFSRESGGVFRVKSEAINGECGSCTPNPIGGGGSHAPTTTCRSTTA